ncbi:MAG: Mpo1-like protein, partial [Burkholderiaceae bacterium]
VFWGLGLFTIGWVIQFIGHYYEGRKPAFVDDLIGLLVGPMFVCAEVLFALRLCRPTREAIEAEAGPVRLRDIHASALR